MSTFQGFKITGVDRNKYPVIMDDQIDYKKNYLALEPIDDCADVEAQKIWRYSFRYVVKHWEQYLDLHHYKGEIEQIPQLEFVVQDNDEFFICADGLSLSLSLGSVSFIQGLVMVANRKCVNKIESIDSHRQHIDQFNSRHFSDATCF